jgi:hypothetical protein
MNNSMSTNKDLGGSDLQRIIAHVGDDQSFINSFNPDTGMYGATLNVTHGQTAGAGVKKYDREDCPDCDDGA